MRKDCYSCINCPEFEFATPVSYDSIGFCDAFPGGVDIVEVEDGSGDADYMYLFEGKPITDCPCWEFADEEHIPAPEKIGVKYTPETIFCDTPCEKTPEEQDAALARIKALCERHLGMPVFIKSF